jgi:hypothetical protein
VNSIPAGTVSANVSTREPDREAVVTATKEIVLVRLAIDPKTGAVDLSAPFVVIPQRRSLQRLPWRGGIYEKEPTIIEQFRPGEHEAQFEAEWSKQEGGWKFGKRVIDA